MRLNRESRSGTGTGISRYVIDKLRNELTSEIQRLQERVTVLEKVAIPSTVIAEVAKTKSLDDLKLMELKALALENGIDTTDFGNKRVPYVEALKVLDLK